MNENINLFTIRDTARQLKVSERMIRKLLRHGGLPYFKVGRTTRIAAEDVRAFLAKHRMRRNANAAA